RIRERAQLRRVLDRVGQPRRRAHRRRHRPRRRPVALSPALPLNVGAGVGESSTMSSTTLPDALAETRDAFHELEQADRLTLLLEFANELPELPERYADHPDLFERVIECQSP